MQAFAGLADRSERIDTDQLANALNTMAALTENTPEEFQAALRGMSDLSENIAARDEQLNTLLGNLRKVSGVLGDRQRRPGHADARTATSCSGRWPRAGESVHDLLTATSQLSIELTQLVRSTRADLKPALDHLDSVVDVLLKNQENLDNSLRLMAPFYRVFANTLGNGPWFDTYIQNLPPVPAAGGGE